MYFYSRLWGNTAEITQEINFTVTTYTGAH